jgi:hypothetical protein
MKRTNDSAHSAAPSTSPFHAGQVPEITFETFTPRITIRSERERHVLCRPSPSAGLAARPGNQFQPRPTMERAHQQIHRDHAAQH